MEILFVANRSTDRHLLRLHIYGVTLSRNFNKETITFGPHPYANTTCKKRMKNDFLRPLKKTLRFS